VLNTWGLALIIIAWIEQLWRTLFRRHLSFSPFFLTIFLIGTALLAYNSFSQADPTSGALWAVITTLAFSVLMIVIIRRRKPGAF
jgi:O-antigen/teichoic acid export membrane protein